MTRYSRLYNKYPICMFKLPLQRCMIRIPCGELETRPLSLLLPKFGRRSQLLFQQRLPQTAWAQDLRVMGQHWSALYGAVILKRIRT